MTEQEIHRKFAIESFNSTWDLLDKTDRSQEEDLKMIQLTHVSRFHWGEIGVPMNFARGDWQISRVYAVLGFGEVAFKYAESSMKHCKKNNIGDFDLAFACEALARASAVSGDTQKVEKYFQLAKNAGDEIEKEEDRAYFLKELSTIPGFK